MLSQTWMGSLTLEITEINVSSGEYDFLFKGWQYLVIEMTINVNFSPRPCPGISKLIRKLCYNIRDLADEGSRSGQLGKEVAEVLMSKTEG